MYDDCSECGGSGYDSGSLGAYPDSCIACGGTGREPEPEEPPDYPYDPIFDLALEERLVASIAVAEYRRKKEEAA